MTYIFLINFIKKYDKYIGIIVGIFGLVLTFYSIYYEDSPDISFEITNEINVIDVKKSLNDLNIYYKGKDIQKNSLNLRIYKITIKNIGSESIKQNYYDKEDKWGFKFNSGQILDVRFVESNSSYLTKQKVNPTIIDNIVSLNKVIFETNKYIKLEVLVLHKKDVSPKILPIGKIAGVEQITPIKTWKKENKENFLQVLLKGGFLVHITRALIYLFLILIFFSTVVLIIILIGSIIERIKKYFRKRKIIDLYNNEYFLENSMGRKVIDIYIKNGYKGIKKAKKYMNDKEKVLELKRKNDKLKKYFLEKDKGKKDEYELSLGYQLRYSQKIPPHIQEQNRNKLLFDLIEEGIIKIENSKVTIDNSFKKALELLITYLNRR